MKGYKPWDVSLCVLYATCMEAASWLQGSYCADVAVAYEVAHDLQNKCPKKKCSLPPCDFDLGKCMDKLHKWIENIF